MTQSATSNIIPFIPRPQLETARGFIQLAQAAERGDIVGAGYTVIDRNGRTRQGLLGAARTDRALALYGAERLAHMLLWPDEYKPAR